MKFSTKIANSISQKKKSDVYLQEAAKLDFSIEMEKRRKHVGMTYAELALKIDASPAYISKVFRGDANLTIDSMVKLASATGAKISIKVLDKMEEVNPSVWLGTLRTKPAANQKNVTLAGLTNLDYPLDELAA